MHPYSPTSIKKTINKKYTVDWSCSIVLGGYLSF